MKNLISLIIAVALFSNVLIANTDTNPANTKTKFISKDISKERNINWKQSFEQKGFNKATIETLDAQSPAQVISDSELIKFRENAKTHLESNKFKKKPVTPPVSPDKIKPRNDADATQKKSHQNQFQGKMETLPNNIRFVAEFEESQAVLVSIPNEMAFLMDDDPEPYPAYFAYNMDEIAKLVLQENKIPIPPGFNVEDVPPG
jgi:hypothetical protein